MKKIRRQTISQTVSQSVSKWAALALLLLVPALPAAAEYGSYPDQQPADGEIYSDDSLGYGGSYSYLRAVEGTITLIQGDDGARSEADLHQPFLAGDRLWVAPRGQGEILLSDRNVLRLGSDTEVELVQLAASPEAQASRTDLRLLAGRLQLVVFEDLLGEEYPRIDTPNATIYVQQPGTYLVTAERSGWTEVVVRQGSAEVLTRRGSLMVRRDEQAVVEGQERVQARVAAAGSWTSLELWGEELERQAARADVGYVDDSLRYAAAPLAGHGSWIDVDRRPAWRPSVAAEWRPYTYGHWTPTPSGLTWVSYEPWGWVPYHYGTWDYVPTYGWIWFPGRVFAPAWVYWYWSSSYVGWCPVGYYTRYYYPRYHHGFRFGLYGWAGGDWGIFAHWNFVPGRYLHYRDQARYVRPSYALRNESRLDRLPRGLITTDTRGVTARELARPEEAMRVLQTRPDRRPVASDLPDVTPFVARQELPEEVLSQVADTRPVGAGTVATPLRPGRIASGGEDKPALERKPAERPVVSSRPVSGGKAPAAVEKPAEGVGEGGARIERRPAPRPEPPKGESGDDRGVRIERRPAPAPQPESPKEEGGGARIERRPAPQPESPKEEGGGARIERRPAPRPEPPKGDSGNDRGVRIERRPATPRSEPPKEEGGGGAARIERRPAPRPEPPKEEGGGGAARIERRPAPRPESIRQPSSSGVRIDRRPAPQAVTPPPSSYRQPSSSGVRIERRPAPRAVTPPPSSYRQPSVQRPPASPPSSGSYRGPIRSSGKSPTVQPPSVSRPPSSSSTYRGPVNRAPSSVRSPSPSRSPSVSRPAPRPSPPPSVRSGSSSRSSAVSRPSKPSSSGRSGTSRGSASRSSGRSGGKGGDGKGDH